MGRVFFPLFDAAGYHKNNLPGTGINWVTFTRGSHMSTWKYGYQDYPFT